MRKDAFTGTKIRELRNGNQDKKIYDRRKSMKERDNVLSEKNQIFRTNMRRLEVFCKSVFLHLCSEEKQIH